MCNAGEPKKPRWFALGLSGAPRITQGGKPPQGVAAINPIMHQEASEEGVQLYSPRAPRETFKRGLGSLQTIAPRASNDRAQFWRMLARSIGSIGEVGRRPSSVKSA